MITGTELWVIRDWLMERTTSESHPLTAVIVDMLNEDIKENILTVEINKILDPSILETETIADCIRNNKKIQTIKTIRQIFGLGLLESKDMADANWDKWASAVSAL